MPSSVIDPLELLTAKEDRKPTFLNTIYNPAACTLAGFGLACMLNWGFRKPILSGIQNHIGFSALGLFGGTYLDKKRNEELATRDAVLRHYVQLHPEDFPPVPRKKFADVLEQWVPIR
ncbi:NADH dehydrogenase (ubiquinone) B14.5 B subunit [Haematobia irritans]|uniref:NADH dehydrogenase [ubiquinone] 1 subunit C2 n=1 Tax=Haematobia irritans TaxID=7368 RepID=A0A1L8EEU8_HAEIR